MISSYSLSVAGQPSSPAPQRRWLVVFLYAIIVAGCLLRLHDAWAHNPVNHLFSDPQRHWDHAKEPTTPSPMAIFDPPIFQMWLSVVQKFTLGVPELVAIYAGLLSVIGPWLWYRFLREAVSSRLLALTGWAALCVLPTWIGIYSYFMTETLFLPLLGLSLWMTARADRKRTTAAFMTMVVLWIITGLTRGIGIPMAGLAAGLVWWRHPQKIRTALFSVVAVVVFLAPLAWRNHHFVYLWAPHGNSWLNKIYAESGARVIQLSFVRGGASWGYGFGSPSIDSKPFAPFSDWTSHREGTVDVFVDFTQGSRDWQASLEKTAVKGARRWQLRWENMLFLFFGDSWPDNNRDYFTGRLCIAARWPWAPWFVVLIGASLWRWRETLARPLLPALIVAWFFFQAWMFVSVNEGRYRKPLEGLLIVQTLVLADQLRRKNSTSPSPASQNSAGAVAS